MANAFGATMAVLIFVTLLIAGGAYYFIHQKKEKDRIEEELRQQRLNKIYTVISSKIRDMVELAVVREDFNAEINFEDKKEWRGIKLPLTGRSLQMSYSGVIVCGCDLKKSVVPQSSVTENSAQIIIPQCQILHIYPQVDTYKIINKNSGLLADDITLEMQSILVKGDLKLQEKRAIDEGILNRANNNVKEILKAQIRPFGVEPQINFLESESVQPALPES